MRRFSLLFVIIGCVALAALLAWYALSADSPGRQTLPKTTPAVAHALDPFRRIEVAGQAEITLVQGAETSILVETPGRDPARVEFEVQGGTLEIHAADRIRWWDFLSGRSKSKVSIIVTFRELESIEAAGAVQIIAGKMRVPKLTIEGAGGTMVYIDDLQATTLDISGAGALKAQIGGSVDRQRITMSGAGEYLGARLASNNASIVVSGVGRAVVNARSKLDATISGAGSVEYIGDPEVTKQISGAGSVRRRGTSADGASQDLRAS